MSESGSICYYDRRNATMLTERIYASGFLFWSYNTGPGRWLTELVFRQPVVSRLYGWWNKRSWSKGRIRPFAQAMGVKVEESQRALEEFACFNDFFTREIDLDRRPIDPDPSVCVAPADGRVLALPAVERDRTFRIKGGSFTLDSFLRDAPLAGQFAGGSMVIVRLHLSDYHHFHFPDSGLAREPRAIPGMLYAVAPYAERVPVPFYAENRRMLTLVESEHFGPIAMVEIGGFTVGSIQQRFRPGVRVAKGARKGFFELGGSTVVLLFQKGAIRLDEDLCARTREGIETYVLMGESIGRR